MVEKMNWYITWAGWGGTTLTGLICLAGTTARLPIAALPASSCSKLFNIALVHPALCLIALRRQFPKRITDIVLNQSHLHAQWRSSYNLSAMPPGEFAGSRHRRRIPFMI